MKNKLVFRVLGALASALVVSSVFIPFMRGVSLWQTNSAVGTIYLPIVILVFGVIGIFVFSTGIKIELGYASAGGLMFYLITQTIPVINQNTFSELGVGYYSLTIGTVLILLMTFLCNLKVKVAEEIKKEEVKEKSMLDQIDKLYNGPESVQEQSEVNDLNSIIQPIQLETLNGYSNEVNKLSTESKNNSLENNEQQLPMFEPDIVPETIYEQDVPIKIIEQLPIQNNEESLKSSTPLMENIPVIEETIQSAVPMFEQSVVNNPAVTEVTSQVVRNPVVSDFSQSVVNNPVASEFEQPVVNNPAVTEVTSQVVNNPGVSDFLQPVVNNPVVPEFSQSVVSNPVVSEFELPDNITPLQNVIATASEEVSTQPLQSINSEKKVDVMSETTNNSSNLDIFN